MREGNSFSLFTLAGEGVPVWGWGATPSQVRTGRGPISKASTCYAAGGVPLAFTQEDFLVILKWRWIKRRIWVLCSNALKRSYEGHKVVSLNKLNPIRVFHDKVSVVSSIPSGRKQLFPEFFLPVDVNSGFKCKCDLMKNSTVSAQEQVGR